MYNSENPEDVLNKFASYVLEMNESIKNYCEFYKKVDSQKLLEKSQFGDIKNDLMCFNISFSEIQKKCDEYNQAFYSVICYYQEQISSLTIQNLKLQT